MDPKIKIKYVDTKNQVADMLSKGSFTHDEWNHLLRLLNIMNFLDVFLQPSCLKQKAKCHVKKKEGKKVLVHRWQSRDL